MFKGQICLLRRMSPCQTRKRRIQCCFRFLRQRLSSHKRDKKKLCCSSYLHPQNWLTPPLDNQRVLHIQKFLDVLVQRLTVHPQGLNHQKHLVQSQPGLGVLAHLSVEFESHHSPGAEKVERPHPDLWVLARLSVEFETHHTPRAEKVGHPHPVLGVLARLSMEFETHHTPGAEKVGHPHLVLGVLARLSVEFETHHTPGAEKVGHPHLVLGILARLSVEFETHHTPGAEKDGHPHLVRSRRSRTPQRGVRNPSQSERGLFPMSQAKYQKSVLGKLVELLDEIKRVGRHYEPLNSAVHVARLETLEDFAEEEARLKDRNLWKQRVSQLSKVGGRNNKDCVHKVMDRLFTNSLMAAFNMKGRGRSEKKAFQDTVFYSVVKVSPAVLASYGNRVLKANEKLISTLVKPTDTNDSVSLSLAAVEVEVFMVGPNVTLDKIPRLDTTNSSVDIDLIGIAKNNNETSIFFCFCHTKSAAVAFMSYNTMENLLKPDFFNTSNDTIKTMMSTVISATLPKTTNTKLTKPVNFTLKHIREFDPDGSLSCVYWNISEWIVDGCSVLKTNSSYTVCSCVHLSTFALIMQTSRPSESDSLLDLLNLVCVIVGLVFFSLALLTFALCQWSPGVNNVARINICISLLLAHLLFLLTQQFLSLIRPHQVLCAVISGVLHFLFLSGFVWMFIEALLLFICVKNLSQISSKKREVLSSGYLCVIGYTVALVVVAVSAVVNPKGYGSEHCWIKIDKGFIWSFLGTVSVILALTMILVICFMINLNSTFKNLKAEVSLMKRTKIITFKTLAHVFLVCPWILGFFTNGRKELEILFLILNSQQGTFMFLVYCVLNNEVRQQYRKFFRCLCCGLKSNTIKKN
ncbi:unnamed protein product [Leuciscus chuanchicus]